MNQHRTFPLLACALVCMILLTPAAQADRTLADGTPTGMWYNPDYSGEGFFVNIVGSGSNLQIALTMFSYDEAGNQLWLYGNSPISKTATVARVPMLLIEGPVWGPGYNMDDRVITNFGTITVRFPTCDSALFQVQSNTTLESGSYPLIRLANIVGIKCTDSPSPTSPKTTVSSTCTYANLTREKFDAIRVNTPINSPNGNTLAEVESILGCKGKFETVANNIEDWSWTAISPPQFRNIAVAFIDGRAWFKQFFEQ